MLGGRSGPTLGGGLSWGIRSPVSITPVIFRPAGMRSGATRTAGSSSPSSAGQKTGGGSPGSRGRERWVREPATSICTNCKRRTSVTAGPIFHWTRVPLLTWFRAAWLMTTPKNGGSAANLGRLLGIDYRTAWTVLHKLRLTTFRPGREPLGGHVEVDESSSAGRKTRIMVGADTLRTSTSIWWPSRSNRTPRRWDGSA